MAYLKISCNGLNLTIDRISQYDLSEFSLKNQYTGESGNTITYPVRMHKKRISITAELYGGIRITPDYATYNGEYDDGYTANSKKTVNITLSADGKNYSGTLTEK